MKRVVSILLILLLIPMASSQIATLTQEQIDNLNSDTIFGYVLSTCETDGLIHIIDNTIVTYFSCYTVEPITDGELYGVYNSILQTTQDLQPYLEVCGDSVPLEVCENIYWEEVTRQGFDQIGGIAREIISYQTEIQNPYDWFRDFLG